MEDAKNPADVLEGARRDECRSIAPTAHYVAADTPDVQYTTSSLRRTLETPPELQEMQLKRLKCCLSAVPEMRWHWGFRSSRAAVRGSGRSESGHGFHRSRLDHSRFGAGRVRHLISKDLWVQEKVRSRRMLLKHLLLSVPGRRRSVARRRCERKLSGERG